MIYRNFTKLLLVLVVFATAPSHPPFRPDMIRFGERERLEREMIP